MELTEQAVTLRKLVAAEGKVLRLATAQFDEDGNEIERQTCKEVYLASTASPDEWEEIPETE